MSQYSFGAGVMYGTSLTNSPPTPVRFGAMQDVSLDFSFTTKELFGSYQFPIAIGRGTGKITGKSAFAQFNAQVFNDLFFGAANPATGVVRASVAEAQTVTANIATATNGANFVADQGVVRASDNAVYTRVTANAVGLQYSLNTTTGVYTFNNTQNAVAVLLNYTYADSANGKKISITNQLLGNAPTFSLAFTETYQGKQQTIILNSCMSSKLTLATKLEDFEIPNFDFQVFADAAGNIGTMNLEE